VPPVAGVHYDIFINNNADLYELIERTQIEGPWPIDHPLPLPRWASKPKDCYQLGSLTQYEKLAGSIEMHVQRLLEEHNYNTVGNFVDLYQNFKKSGYCTFFKFFQRYNTPNPPNLHLSFYWCFSQLRPSDHFGSSHMRRLGSGALEQTPPAGVALPGAEQAPVSRLLRREHRGLERVHRVE
jgi:hypothetical protein